METYNVFRVSQRHKKDIDFYIIYVYRTLNLQFIYDPGEHAFISLDEFYIKVD
jgi:hypothetical protein